MLEVPPKPGVAGSIPDVPKKKSNRGWSAEMVLVSSFGLNPNASEGN